MSEPYKGGSTFRMPFGKYNKHMLCVIPLEYMTWLEKELLIDGKYNTSDEIMVELKAEIKRRKEYERKNKA
jgi:uncharacterized protein (DUF3820 family)